MKKLVYVLLICFTGSIFANTSVTCLPLDSNKVKLGFSTILLSDYLKIERYYFSKELNKLLLKKRNPSSEEITRLIEQTDNEIILSLTSDYVKDTAKKIYYDGKVIGECYFSAPKEMNIAKAISYDLSFIFDNEIYHINLSKTLSLDMDLEKNYPNIFTIINNGANSHLAWKDSLAPLTLFILLSNKNIEGPLLEFQQEVNKMFDSLSINDKQIVIQ